MVLRADFSLCVSLGTITSDDCSIRILLGVGNLARDSFAFGGAAIGVVAVGGSATDKYVISGLTQNPEAIRFSDIGSPESAN